jgi:nitrite reductase/ring-hydroxylating ferredoxin subunit
MASLAGFFKAIFGICETPPLNAELWRMEGKRVAIRLAEATALVPVGGAVRLEGKGLASSVLIVHADSDEYLAFENRCTHGGRRLDPVEGRPELRCCSVGHSRFDYQGNKLSGPAKGPLTLYRVETQGEELIVSLETASA